MTFTADYAALKELRAGADHCDIKAVDVDRPADAACLREFIAGFLNYNPAWIKSLYLVRAGFVRLLGMRQEGIPQAPRLRADAVPFAPGARAAFFEVVRAEEGRHWFAAASESHLTAHVGVILEARGAASRLHVVTLVRYNRWTGPVYFNVIRPFHHLVVARMLRAGAIQARQARSVANGTA
ncbi:MAG TPA: DUF2867 domain-containing protein [Herpetosiphonaceae bacterium]|nr:DUF2867 domain-containing protein [Herpetosiphonaceae bacterium]